MSPLEAEKLAGALADVLRDEPWWDRYTARPDDAAWRAGMARKAVDLYRLTAPVLESDLAGAAGRVQASLPVLRAVAALREIADACAMLSVLWGGSDREPNIPTRAAIELGISIFDLRPWASALGSELVLTQPHAFDEVWEADAQPDESDESPDELAEVFTQAIEIYDDAWKPGADRAWLDTADARNGFGKFIASARDLLGWARGTHNPGAETAAAAVLHLGQGFFTASWRGSDAEPFPSPTFLRSLLHHSDGYAWLTSYGAKIPDWLS